MNPLLLCDYYKTEHFKMYPDSMTKLYSNFTPRKSRIAGIEKVVVFGIQHFILEYLIKKFNENFFCYEPNSNYRGGDADKARYKESIISEYKRHINVDTKHIEALWDLGYLPIEIKSLDEGTLCPIGVPMLTITNTHPDFGWLVNYLETLISCSLWQPITSATIAYEYKKLLTKYAKETDEKNVGFVNWQGHDFSMRGMSSVESAILSGMGHLLSFTGTDTVPAIYQLESNYNAEGLIGASVPATEHSVMCMGTKEAETKTFKKLLEKYPTDILSVVSDTWDLWKVITEILPTIKDEILSRDGKLVIRPDSGDPVDIVCGYPVIEDNEKYPNYSIQEYGSCIFKGKLCIFDQDSYQSDLEEYGKNSMDHNHLSEYIVKENIIEAAKKGVIELLWDIFGGTTNEQGYKVLDPHIGAIYGDSITVDRAKQICERLKAKGFASTNVVLGIGSYTYQYNTRDTFGFAMKATYGEVLEQVDSYLECGADPKECWKPIGREIFKDPITDDGTKKSKKGLLRVTAGNGTLQVKDQCSWEDEQHSLLETVFLDGKLIKETSLEKIREKLNSYI